MAEAPKKPGWLSWVLGPLLGVAGIAIAAAGGAGAETAADAKESPAEAEVAAMADFARELTPEKHLDMTRDSQRQSPEGRRNILHISHLIADVTRHGRAATAPILARLPKSDKWEAFWLLEALSDLKDPQAVETLVRFASGDDADYRGRGIRGLMVLGPVGVAPLVRLCEDPRPAVRQAAVGALTDVLEREKGRLSDDQTEAIFGAAICLKHDADTMVRYSTMFTLAKGDRRYTPHLVAFLEDSDPLVVGDTIPVLGERGDPAAVPALMKILLRHRDEHHLSKGGRLGYSAALAVAKLADLTLPPLRKTYRDGGSPPHAVPLPVEYGHEEQMAFVVRWWQTEGEAKYGKPETVAPEEKK